MTSVCYGRSSTIVLRQGADPAVALPSAIRSPNTQTSNIYDDETKLYHNHYRDFENYINVSQYRNNLAQPEESAVSAVRN